MGGLVQRIRVITDDLADDIAKAYSRRGKDVKGPITIKELPEDVVAKAVKAVEEVAPQAQRRRVLDSLPAALRSKKFLLGSGAAITATTLLDASDGEFFNLLTQLTPDALREFGALVANAPEGDAIAEASQSIGDIMYVSQMRAVDYDADKWIQPVDRSIGNGLGIKLEQVQQLQALTNTYEQALEAVGGMEILEAIIYISNNTTAEDRVALYDNYRHKRGF